MESFEHRGVWWFPEDPEKKYPGTLSFDPINGGNLELVKPPDIYGKCIDIIHGLVQEDGQEVLVTLSGMFGYGEAKMTVDYIYKGRHFDKIEDIVFEELSVSYTHLNNWMTDHDIRLHYHNTKISSITGVSLQNEARITIISQEKLHFKEYCPLFNFHLPNFLTLATGLINYPFNIKGIISDNPREVGIYYQNLYVDKSRSTSYMEKLFSFKDVKNNLSTYLSNWINKSEELWAVYDEYFQFYHQRYIELKSQFLSFTRALEAYHRNRYDGVYLTPEEYEPIKQALIKAIPDYVENSHQDKLKGMIKYGYQFSLRKQLKMICNEILGEYKEIVEELLGDSNSFVDKVIATRNYLTHNPKERPKNVIPDEKLYYYIRKMQSLLRICFLVEMGFPPDEIKRLMREYKFLIE